MLIVCLVLSKRSELSRLMTQIINRVNLLFDIGVWYNWE